MTTAEQRAAAIDTVLILGAGTMGQGIAQVVAQAGAEARVFDVEKERVEKAFQAIDSITKKRVEKGKMDAADQASLMKRLTVAESIAAGASGAALIIEAAPESMDLKVKILGEAKAAATGDALLASNTSSLSVTEMGTRLEAADRVVGMHFFNPPPVMALLEIVRGLATSEHSVALARALAERFGKTPIVVNDAPGFATSRLGVAIGAEAIRMLEAGVASAADIDRAMELGYRHPMGPLKLTDLVGLDVRLAILEHLHREVGEQFRPPSLLRQMVRAGRLGKKAGIGFYRWTADGPVPADGD